LVETALGLRLDHAVIQTWMPRPTHLLPETESGTLTNLVLRYAQPKPTLSARHEQGRISGELFDPAGKPVAGAEVLLAAEDSSSVSVRSAAGTVPEEASTALRAPDQYRMQLLWGADLTFAEMRYREAAQTYARAFSAPPSPTLRQTSAGLKIAVAGTDRLALNTEGFPVSPGTRFTAEIPLGATPASTGSGYIALIFLNAERKEIQRERLALEAGDKVLGKAVTDRSGRFQMKPDAGLLAQERAIRAEFQGNDRLRAARAALP
jgi:hypothetical protein